MFMTIFNFSGFRVEICSEYFCSLNNISQNWGRTSSHDLKNFPPTFVGMGGGQILFWQSFVKIGSLEPPKTGNLYFNRLKNR